MVKTIPDGYMNNHNQPAMPSIMHLHLIRMFSSSWLTYVHLAYFKQPENNGLLRAKQLDDFYTYYLRIIMHQRLLRNRVHEISFSNNPWKHIQSPQSDLKF